MSHSQFHCTGRVYLDMHGLIFETSICYWQDQPGSGTEISLRLAARQPPNARPPARTHHPPQIGAGRLGSRGDRLRREQRPSVCGAGQAGRGFFSPFLRRLPLSALPPPVTLNRAPQPRPLTTAPPPPPETATAAAAAELTRERTVGRSTGNRTEARVPRLPRVSCTSVKTAGGVEAAGDLSSEAAFAAAAATSAPLASAVPPRRTSGASECESVPAKRAFEWRG